MTWERVRALLSPLSRAAIMDLSGRDTAGLCGRGAERASAIAKGLAPSVLAATQHGALIVARREPNRGEPGARMRAVAEGLALTATTGAPEVSPSDLQCDSTRALPNEGWVGHRDYEKLET